MLLSKVYKLCLIFKIQEQLVNISSVLRILSYYIVALQWWTRIYEVLGLITHLSERYFSNWLFVIEYHFSLCCNWLLAIFFECTFSEETWCVCVGFKFLMCRKRLISYHGICSPFLFGGDVDLCMSFWWGLQQWLHLGAQLIIKAKVIIL